jgi:hypothetical protein
MDKLTGLVYRRIREYVVEFYFTSEVYNYQWFF